MDDTKALISQLNSDARNMINLLVRGLTFILHHLLAKYDFHMNKNHRVILDLSFNLSCLLFNIKDAGGYDLPPTSAMKTCNEGVNEKECG